MRIDLKQWARRIKRDGVTLWFAGLEIHYLWLPSPELAIRRIAQRVKMGGHGIPNADVRRRFDRSRRNFTTVYAPLADLWTVWDNQPEPPRRS